MSKTKRIEFKWEKLSQLNTFRAKVIGGWIISYTPRYCDDLIHKDPAPFATALVFVPDEWHEWEI